MINSHNEAKKLAALFKRKISGVYMFGTRRVNIKVENGKLYGIFHSILIVKLFSQSRTIVFKY